MLLLPSCHPVQIRGKFPGHDATALRRHTLSRMPPQYICPNSTRNPHLKEWIGAHGEVRVCSDCGAADQPAVDVCVFALHVDSVIRRNTYPVLHPEPDEDDGEDPIKVISRLAGVNDTLAAIVPKVGRYSAPDTPFFYDYNLGFTGRFPIQHQREWMALSETVRHEARFFGAQTKAILDKLLGDLETFCGGVTIRVLGPNTVLYRARLERAAGEAEAFFKAPETALQAPRKDKATPGRMNAAGIRVFYAALREDVAVAELRPPIGSHVVCGGFSPTRQLRVLDLAALGGSLQHVDMFSPEYEALAQRIDFLHELESEISLPVQPYDETLAYVTTQVVGEYVAQVLRLDGIIYRSAQVRPTPDTSSGEPQPRNVVLFRSAAITEAEGLVEGLPCLRFVPDSARMFDVTNVQVKYELNMWAHYQDPSVEEEGEEKDQEEGMSSASGG